MTQKNNICITASRLALTTLAIFIGMVFTQATASAQTVLTQKRIGGYGEDITYVTSGPLKDKIVISDGYELFAVPNGKKAKEPMVRLFGTAIPEMDVFPNGITFIESEGLLVLNNDTRPSKLFLFDQAGAFKGTRTVQYQGGYQPGHIEGMAYIPASSPLFPDHLIMVAWDTLQGPMRLVIMRRDGVVVAEIFKPDWPEEFSTAAMGDVTYLSPNRLLVSLYDSTLWTIDFSGNILSGPHAVAGVNGFEGIVQLSDGNIAAVALPQSILYLDKNLARLPDNDRNDKIGLDVNIPTGIAWDSNANQFLITHGLATASLVRTLSAVPDSLASVTDIVDLEASGFTTVQRLAYLPNEHLIAATSNNPRAILLFNNNGTLNSQINLSPAALGQNLGNPIALTYIPTTNEFVVVFNGLNGNPDQPAERRRLRVFSRAGTLVRTIDLTCTGTGGVTDIAYFEDSGGGGGRFMILGSAGRVFITDLDGNSRNGSGFLFGEFNSRVKLSLITRNGITAITTGPHAGGFAVLDRSGGEIVIFRIN